MLAQMLATYHSSLQASHRRPNSILNIMKSCTVLIFTASCAFLFVAQTHTSVVKKRAADTEQLAATTLKDLEEQCRTSQEALTQAFHRMLERLKACNKELGSKKQKQSNCTGLSAYNAAQDALSRSVEECLLAAIRLRNAAEDEEVEEENISLMHQYQSRLVANETISGFLRNVLESEQRSPSSWTRQNDASTPEDQEVCPTTFRVSSSINCMFVLRQFIGDIVVKILYMCAAIISTI